MSAVATLTTVLALQVPAPLGTSNELKDQVDASASITATTDTIAQISIVPDDAITGDDQKIRLQLMAEVQSVVADPTPDEFACTAHGYPEGQAVILGGTAAPAGLTLGTVYYIVPVDVDTFQLAAGVGSAALDFTTAGTAVTVRAVGRVVLTYEYPGLGPAVPVEVRDSVNGRPNDFTKVRALQIVLRPLDDTLDALGTVQLEAGDDTDRFNHFNLPLRLAYTAGGPQNWPSWLAALPDGFVYDPDNHLTVRILSDETNVNLLILINLLGN